MKYKYEQIEKKPDKEYKSKKIHKNDCIALCQEKVFQPSISVEKAYLQKREKVFQPSITFEKSSLSKKEKHFHRSHLFDWEMFQWADYEFVNWANSMPETIIMAVMAEMKQAPKMKPDIESLRTQVKEIPCCSIE